MLMNLTSESLTRNPFVIPTREHKGVSKTSKGMQHLKNCNFISGII